MPMLHPYYGPKKAKMSLVHEEKAIPMIQKILTELNFELLIEFGTSWGGMTLVMHDALPECEIHSFDISDKRVPNFAWFDRNTTNIIFHRDADILTENQDVIDLLKRPEKKFLYCDNGNKPLEFEIYSPFLASDDFIGVHDFDNEYKKENITDLPIMVDFIPYKHEIFEQNKWSTRLWKKE